MNINTIIRDFCIFWFPFAFDRESYLHIRAKKIENQIIQTNLKYAELKAIQYGIREEIAYREGNRQ